jgi:hypothetical protein
MTARRERAGDETANGIRTDCIARLRSRVAIARDDDREKRPHKQPKPVHKRRPRENPERSRQGAQVVKKRRHINQIQILGQPSFALKLLPPYPSLSIVFSPSFPAALCGQM